MAFDMDALTDEILATMEDPAFQEKRKNFPKFDPETIDRELKSHPFFMKAGHIPTQEEIDASPELQAMQSLKYDCDTPYEKAVELKDDGNEHFKRKLYKKAIKAYGAALGLRVNALPTEETDQWTKGDLEKLTSPAVLNAQLATNRATSQFFCKNYRSCVKDCAIAVKFYPKHMKAYRRACLALEKLQNWEEMIGWAQYGLSRDPEHAEIKQILQSAIKAQKLAERDERKRQVEKRKLQREKAKIAAVVKSRKYPFKFSEQYISEMVKNVSDEHTNVTENTDPWLLTLISPLVKNRITINAENALTLPILFLYPQYKTTDLVEYCDERTFLSDLIGEMFSQKASWDEDDSYDPVEIEVFYYNKKIDKYLKLSVENPMYDILPKMSIEDGMINLTVVSRRSKVFYKDFLKNKEYFN